VGPLAVLLEQRDHPNLKIIVKLAKREQHTLIKASRQPSRYFGIERDAVGLCGSGKPKAHTFFDPQPVVSQR